MTPTEKRYIRLRVEYPNGTSDHHATELGDQLVEFASTFGDAYIEDEGTTEASEEEE